MKFYNITSRMVQNPQLLNVKRGRKKIPSLKLLKGTSISDRNEWFILTTLSRVKKLV
jgi:hypothetical protein